MNTSYLRLSTNEDFLNYPLQLVVPDDIRNLSLKSQTKKESFPYKMMKLLNFQFLLVILFTFFLQRNNRFKIKIAITVLIFFLFEGKNGINYKSILWCTEWDIKFELSINLFNHRWIIESEFGYNCFSFCQQH